MRSSTFSFITLACFLVALSSNSFASEALERDMSDDEFREAGLHRLSAEELAFLNRWLGRKNSAEPGAAFGAEQLKATTTSESVEDLVTTTVIGDFIGWSGRTTFRLANGQTWQQRLPGKYRYNAQNPEVILKRGRFGYYLELVASGRQIAVKRLK